MKNQELLTALGEMLDKKLQPIKDDLVKLDQKVESICQMLEEDIARIEDENVENFKATSRLRSTLKRKGII